MTYWTGLVGPKDDFGDTITDVFYDAPTRFTRQWAIMTPGNWKMRRLHALLGTGKGQKYVKQSDGRWLKTEG